jgi:O-antigen/teichoic acid export membrane protein
LPDKFYLQGVVSVILPAFAAHIRDGRTLREPYLRAISLITGFQWPALVVLAFLAHPVVQILFGSQWYGVVPLVQIMAIAAMFSFSFELNYPVLVAMGAVRDSFIRCLLIWPASALIITVFAFFGLKAVAVGMLVVVPFQAFVSLHFVRRHIDIAWTDIAQALWRSLVVAGMSAVGPALVMAFVGFNSELPIWELMLAAALAAAGWLAGLVLTSHALLREIRSTYHSLGLDRFIGRVKQVEPVAAG